MGGNQYINSSALGNWADFLIHEMLPEVDKRYRTLAGPAHRGLFGKSSGGYGAIYHGMEYADHWGAIACHSGDMFFDLAYRSDFPATLMHLAGYESVEAFMKRLSKGKKISGDAMHTLMILAMAATYDPDPTQPFGVRLPVDLNTCELDVTAWQRWLKSDPVEMIGRADVQANLNKLKGIYIDCGSRDQYALVFGARKLRSMLDDLGITHVFEEFPDNHSSVDYRMDISLPFLYRSLMGD
jgi:S-formylglutathione hydrolase FrmB